MINSIGIVFILIFFGLCKPEEEMYAPTIVFTEPVAGLVVYLPDTIDVVAQISDRDIIRSVTLTLVNENKTPVLSTQYFYPDSSVYLLNTSMPLVDKTLTSNPYSLLVTVSDGKSQKNQYQPIILKEIPKELKSYLVMTAQFGFETNIIRLNPSFEPDTQFVFPHGYVLSAVHSTWEEFFFVTPEPSELISLNPENFQVEWSMAASPPRPTFTALVSDNDLVFSTANGDAGLVSSDGNISLRTQSFESKIITRLAADDNYIFAAHVSLSGDIHELTVFSRITGDIWEQRPISGEIRSLVPVAGKLLIFLQIASNAEILDYDPVNFILTELNFLPGETINTTIKISDQKVLILTDQRVISYFPETHALSGYKDEKYGFGRYEALSDVVFLARDTTLYGFSGFNGDLTEEKSFSEKIVDFQILYNK